MKFWVFLIFFCAAALQAQTFTVGEKRGEVFIDGKPAVKTDSSFKTATVKTGQNSRFSVMTCDGDITVTVAPSSHVKIAGNSIEIKEGSILVSCYSDTVSVSVRTASGKCYTVKDAEALFSCRGKKELAAVTDGTVSGITGNAAVAKEIQKEFILKQNKKQDKKRNAPLFDENSARPGA